ncbi:thiosulfate sulfurtransferase Tum1p [[Candida] anglica]
MHIDQSLFQPNDSELGTMSKNLLTISPKGFRALLSGASSTSRVIPVDATWYMPNSPHNARKQFKEERLENGVFFDLDSVTLPDSKYPHMLPTFEHFKNSVSQLGIKKDDKVVVYDKQGIFSSPRVAWNFSLFGHQNVYLLDNYNTYKKSEYPLDTKSIDTNNGVENVQYETISNEKFDSNYKSQVIEYTELLDLVKSGKLEEDYVFFDARSTDRFTGESPEPRPGLPSGHVPSSLSLPFTKVLNTDKTFKSRSELIELFKNDYGIDFESSDFPKKHGIIVSCGTGVTAVILRVAIESVIGSTVPIRVYDGSWTEWAQRAPSEFIITDV